MILMWIYSAAAGECESVKLAGTANPLTGEPYREEECQRIRELATDCPTNPLVPGTQGFDADASRRSVREHQRTASTAGGSVQEMVDDALKDLRARTLLARHVPTLLKQYPTRYDEYYKDSYNQMDRQCATSFEALRARFPMAMYNVTVDELCASGGNTLGIQACKGPSSVTDHPR